MTVSNKILLRFICLISFFLPFFKIFLLSLMDKCKFIGLLDSIEIVAYMPQAALMGIQSQENTRILNVDFQGR